MDLIIKNLDHLGNYHNGHNVPIGKVVSDFDKLGKDDFTQIFFSACEKYVEVDESYPKGVCRTCRYDCSDPCEDPCNSCIQSDEISPNWEPKGPNLKELYKKYVEVGESYIVPNEVIKKSMESEKICRTCKYHDLKVCEEPCQSCIVSYLSQDEINPNWEPAEPTLKEVTERMQSEFDATGKDVKIFMNGRIIKR